MTDNLAAELKKIALTEAVDLVLFASLYNYFGEYIRHGGFFNNNWPRFFKKSIYLQVYSPMKKWCIIISIICAKAILDKLSYQKIII